VVVRVADVDTSSTFYVVNSFVLKMLDEVVDEDYALNI
jgi:hypothetical protein